jgi:hypothetical protein
MTSFWSSKLIAVRSAFRIQLRLSTFNARTIANCVRTCMLISDGDSPRNIFIDSFGGGIR